MSPKLRLALTVTIFGTALIGCRSSNEPILNIQPGMRATIFGKPWVADSTIAGLATSGGCTFLMVTGWSKSGSSYHEIMLAIPSALTAPDSCPPGGNYYDATNQIYTTKGALYLTSRTSTNVQGTFALDGGTVLNGQGIDSTFVSEGEFNVNISP